MIARPNHRKCLLWGLSMILACLISFTSAHAGTLENGLKEWFPTSIQGPIMDVKGNYIVISEIWIAIMDTSYHGKAIKTTIRDSNGVEKSRSTLKKGALVFVKGGLARDEKLNTDVLLATEVVVLGKLLNLKDESQLKQYNDPAKPW